MGNVTEAFFNGPSAVPEPSETDPAGATGVSDPGGSSPYGGGNRGSGGGGGGYGGGGGGNRGGY